MEKVFFSVQGSEDEPYAVEFVLVSEKTVNVFCTCRSGFMHSHCKHWMNILAGDTEDMVSGNPDDIPKVQRWVAGSTLGKALDKLAAEKKVYDDQKAVVTRARSAVDRAMRS